MADNKVNSGLLEFSEDQKVFIALDAETSEVKKAVTIDGDGVETDIAGGGGSVTVEALSVTENGTYSEEGKAYSPVTVNVEAAASDFSTAEVVVATDGTVIRIPYLFDGGEVPSALVSNGIEESATYIVPMYKGSVVGVIPTLGRTVAVTGNAEWDDENETITITGDCTITVSIAL